MSIKARRDRRPARKPFRRTAAAAGLPAIAGLQV
jgi:hypothetical protein